MHSGSRKVIHHFYFLRVLCAVSTDVRKSYVSVQKCLIFWLFSCAAYCRPQGQNSLRSNSVPTSDAMLGKKPKIFGHFWRIHTFPYCFPVTGGFCMTVICYTCIRPDRAYKAWYFAQVRREASTSHPIKQPYRFRSTGSKIMQHTDTSEDFSAFSEHSVACGSSVGYESHQVIHNRTGLGTKWRTHRRWVLRCSP